MSGRDLTGTIGLSTDELDTPCLVVDLKALERNLNLLTSLLTNSHTALRPHAKTHKSPVIARMQLERGAIGICCAKLGEAEVMGEAGIPNLLVTTEIVGREKVARLMRLAARSAVTTVIDDRSAAAAISDAALSEGLCIPTLVDLNVGQDRTGVHAGPSAVELARAISKMPGLRLVGVQGYEGHLQHIVDASERRAQASEAFQLLAETVELLERDGHRMEVVSTAGTGTFDIAMDFPKITEVQPGSYVFMDTDYGRVEGIHFEPAIRVLSTVISVPGRGDAIVDAGLKALSSDSGPAVPLRLGTTYLPQGDEHGKLVNSTDDRFVLGEQVSLFPSHCDTTVNLYDSYVVVSEGRVVDVWPVAARGRLQ